MCRRQVKRVKSEEQLNEEVEQDEQSASDEVPKYTSRKLLCTKCHAPLETRRMQLRTIDGFRAIHCKDCGRQERAALNHCTCGVIWHGCELHRIDPKVHESRKGIKTATRKQAQEEIALSSQRKAPHTRQGKDKEETSTKKNRKRKAEDRSSGT